MSSATIKFFLPFVISGALLLLVINSVRGEAADLTDALGKADWRLIVPAVVLIGTAVAVLLPAGKSSMANPGIHGFSEALYAFSSASNNNGSAFAGLNANTPFYNTSLGIAFLFGRYWLAVPVLALAGSLARKKLVPPGLGTLATHTPLFVVLLVGTVILVGALTYVPALALGPIAEHLTLVMAK